FVLSGPRVVRIFEGSYEICKVCGERSPSSIRYDTVDLLFKCHFEFALSPDFWSSSCAERLHKGDFLGIGVIFGCVRREECGKLSHKSLVFFSIIDFTGSPPYSLSEGVAIGNATTGGGCIGEGTRCGGFGC